MQGQIDQAQFIEILKDGIDRTVSYMAQLTEYHGGPIETEYVLTADIARAFLDRGFEVRVECLNRQLVNGFSMRKGWKPRSEIGSKRTDVAVINAGLDPQAMVEVKIGVGAKLRPIKEDLVKIANTLECMAAGRASRVRAASVFQVHTPGTMRDLNTDRLKITMLKKETSLRAELQAFASNWPDLTFQLISLQNHDAGFYTTEIVHEDEVTQSLGRNGHATRYYAVLLKSVRED